jgi:hypothetical protein
MSLTLIVPPHCEPVRLSEAKIFLRIETNEEDELLGSLIRTARQAVEACTAKSLICQSWELKTSLAYCLSISDDNYLTGHKSRGKRGLEIPRSPFIRLIEKPKLVNDYGTQEISSYRLDTAGRVARMHFSKLHENVLYEQSIIQVQFEAGYGNTPENVPEPLRQAILMVVAELYEKRVSLNDNQKAPPTLNFRAFELVKPYRAMRLF